MSSLDQFGLSASGLNIPRMADMQAALQAQWQAAFGQQVNLDPRSNNGQLIAIMAERFALLAELLEAIYNASFPSGAEGVAVDNLLALQGLTRLPASATKTAPSAVVQGNGITVYGLVLYGTPGTVVPAGSLIADQATPPNSFSTQAAITIGAAQNATQTLVFHQTPDRGTFSLTLYTPDGKGYQTPSIPFDVRGNTTKLQHGSRPNNGTFLLRAGAKSVTLSYHADADADAPLLGREMATALNTLLGVTTIVGTGDLDAGIYLDWNAVSVPALSTADQAISISQPLQATINAMVGADGTSLPFAGVSVTRAGVATTFVFGGNLASGGQSTAGARPTAVPLLTVAKNELFVGSALVNLSVSNTVQGHPAQGVGAATCTKTGPITVTAGQLATIQTVVAGWDSVINQLDCMTGTDAETDAEALARRSSLVANQAQGPLAAILQRVRALPGVTAAVAFTNTSLAAQQVVTVSAQASGGTFMLTVAGQTSAALPYNVTAGALQAALRALDGYSATKVTGAVTSGLVIDWSTSQGGQPVPMVAVANNTTGTTVSTQWGRLPKSVELVVQGGADADVAQAIFAAAPAGLATYGQTVLSTTATTKAGSAVITVADTTGLVVGLGCRCLGVPAGALVTSVAKNQVTMSASSLSDYSNTGCQFLYALPVADSSGNAQIVCFSRPTAVQIFCRIVLVTDLYNEPGDQSSGLRPGSQFAVGSIPSLQRAVKDAVSAVEIGGTISATGSGGVANSFRDKIPGVEDATVYVGFTADTTNTGRLQLTAEQVPVLNLADILVSFT